MARSFFQFQGQELIEFADIVIVDAGEHVGEPLRVFGAERGDLKYWMPTKQRSVDCFVASRPRGKHDTQMRYGK
jgi:hypothetical protein